MTHEETLALSKRQAYLCMFEFLRQHYDRGPTDVVGGLLGGMSLLQNGSSADPAAWFDWEQAIQTVVTAEQSSGGYQEANFRLG